MNKKQINLFIALGAFIQAMRDFVSTEMRRKYGDSWDRKYFDKLLPQLQDSWGKSLQEGIPPQDLIDFGNLNSFAIGAKRDFFFDFFGKKSNNLPAIFNELAEVRNAIAHYLPIDDDKSEKAYLHMIELAKKLEESELEASLRKLKHDSFGVKRATISTTKPPPVPQRKRFKKADALGIVNEKIGAHKLNHRNTAFSNINISAPCWWLNISPEKFVDDLNILLVEEGELIWIALPQNTCVPPDKYFNVRNDNGKIDMRIGIEGHDYLRDTLNEENFDFKPFIRKRISIGSNDGII